jgi:hypothetical protein
MSENSEQLRPNNERGFESREAVDSQIEKLANKLERQAELSPDDAEAKTEKARKEALESAVSVESGSAEKEKAHINHTTIRRGPIDKKTRDKSYKQTVHRIQNELPTGERAFSKLIHSKAIENSSEVLANTVARPNAILAGGVAAFILTLATYVTAKTLGYKLSGSETIAAFIIGWVVGLIYDYFRLLITGKKS